MILKIQKSILTNKKRFFINNVLVSENKFIEARHNKCATLVKDSQLHTIYKIY